RVSGSQNSVAANLAEGWNNRHSNIYLEGINRALGELRETRHHILMASRKGHIPKGVAEDLLNRYSECGRMLRGLERSVEKSIERKTSRSTRD
ncbi:MAG TPA: four helix bundle protein, partial [Thermoanaerobaculia bacterium]|nr:four helix bundle protein [Thermoanaerobaculia bacterium]